jgi:hypothetical protein
VFSRDRRVTSFAALLWWGGTHVEAQEKQRERGKGGRGRKRDRDYGSSDPLEVRESLP